MDSKGHPNDIVAGNRFTLHPAARFGAGTAIAFVLAAAVSHYASADCNSVMSGCATSVDMAPCKSYVRPACTAPPAWMTPSELICAEGTHAGGWQITNPPSEWWYCANKSRLGQCNDVPQTCGTTVWFEFNNCDANFPCTGPQQLQWCSGANQKCGK